VRITYNGPLTTFYDPEYHCYAKIMYVSTNPRRHLLLTDINPICYLGLNLMTHIFPVAARLPTLLLKAALGAATQRRLPSKRKLTTLLVS
jgi:hypothetical protein